jgi:hypothetical protein
MQTLYQERYRGSTTKHFHEQLVERHGYKLSYTVTRLALQSAGLVAPRNRRGGRHRKKRERRPLPGMLLFQDGSMHCWIGALDHDLDLVVTLDDATGAIYSAALVDEEGTASSFLRLAGQGQFRALYTDRGSHYFLPTAGSRSSTGRAVSPASILMLVDPVAALAARRMGALLLHGAQDRPVHRIVIRCLSRPCTSTRRMDDNNPD